MAKRPDEAALAYERALGAAPDDADVNYCYAVALWHAGGDTSAVVRALEKALQLDPARAGDARYRYEYGLACMLAGMKGEARAAFARVRRIDRAYKADRVERHLKRLGGE